MSQRCQICGAVIGDDNAIGIGGGCLKNVYMPAKKECFKELKGLELWIAKSQATRDIFVEAFAEKSKRFRSNFKKNFYASMITAERISKKQWCIMANWLEEVGINTDEHESNIYWAMFNTFTPENECPELFAEKLEMFKKIYLSSKSVES